MISGRTAIIAADAEGIDSDRACIVIHAELWIATTVPRVAWCATSFWATYRMRTEPPKQDPAERWALVHQIPVGAAPPYIMGQARRAWATIDFAGARRVASWGAPRDAVRR